MEGKMKVPKVRFPEFEGEWEEKKGRQLFNNKRKKGESHLPIYSVTQDQGLVPRDSLQRHMANNASDEANLQANPGDLVYNMMRMWQGAVGICHQDCMVSPAYVILEPRNVNSEFFIQLFKNTRYLYFLNVFSQGITSDRLRLYYRDFVQIKFNVPTLPEQQKIAAFLTTIDTRIQQLSRKKALLEQYKKRVMQQIFSQEIRFKDEDGNEFPAWEEKRLGDVAKITMGQSPESESYNNEGNGIYLIQGNADISNNKTSPRTWTTRPTKQCEVGDLILSVRAPVGTVAVSMHIACLGRGVAAIRTNRLHEKAFLFQLLLWFEPKWVRLGQGSTFTAINSKDIDMLRLDFPSLPEQQKIATFLSTLDAKIDQANQQLEQMQVFKKGLLQQMFV